MTKRTGLQSDHIICSVVNKEYNKASRRVLSHSGITKKAKRFCAKNTSLL